MSFFTTQRKAPTLFWCMVIAFIALMAFPADAFGQRSRSRSSGSRSSYKQPSRNKSASQNRSRTNKQARPSQKNNSSKSWGSSNKSKSTKATKADRALHDRAKKQGTHFQNRQQATAAFATKKGPELRAKNPVRFDSKPATRPSYIPQTYSSGGNTYNISYNPGYGGYGYMNALGTWVMYDIMWNQAFVNNQMRTYGYAYGPAPSAGPGAGMVLGIIVGVVVIGGVIFFVVASNSESESRAA
tara:strand:+ start:32616 stop:33341 length:726 start_codon:yes stop_codon:yes gene_type:complete